VYSELFGWTHVDNHDLGAERGRHVTFTWNAAGSPVGSTSDIARRAYVHPQWLFFLRTDNLDASLDVVRDMGGLVQRTTETPGGDRLVPCDDPQGAAFGLFEPRHRR
jgi:predicted enzyme related to lactoylglutathione lyase